MAARPPLPRRTLLLALPLLGAGCAGDDAPRSLPPLVTGYRHLTPIRLNVATIGVAEPEPGAVRVAEPAPVRPEAEMRRMAEERLVAMGSEGEARFVIQAAEFRRDRLPPAGGLTGVFGGDPGERLTVRLQGRLDVLGEEGRRVGFVEAEARAQHTLPAGSSAAARARAAEEVMRQAMNQLNVEFEYQVRRTLRAWLVEGAAPATAPAPIEREDLPRDARS